MYMHECLQEVTSIQLTPLTRVAFVYNGPKGMELAPNPRYNGGSQKALGGSGSFKLVMLAPRTVREMTQLPKKPKRMGTDKQIKKHKCINKWMNWLVTGL